jgi:deoxyribodipyrimidine photo-lyase
MACVDLAMGELERDGWMVNQTRMWMASQWAVRHGADWTKGEDHFFRHLLDGSRAANRLGWQWTAGLLTGKPYGFSRWQVEKRAPGLCKGCQFEQNCPIQGWPEAAESEPVETDSRLRSDPNVDATAGPTEVRSRGNPEVVWITAESLGDDDPALAANPDIPAVFVFDRRLLERIELSAKRLVFLAECLADLATRRPLEVHLGSPGEVLADRLVASTFTPVPGWRKLSRVIDPVEIHPWPWLRRPHAGPVSSFSAWRKRLS